jgi:acyl-CoA synthetase (AMP-forming)/AMP-acid ligase II
MNITEPIRRQARLNPTAIAVVRADHSTVSYRGFERMIDAAARYLFGNGHRRRPNGRPGDHRSR